MLDPYFEKPENPVDYRSLGFLDGPVSHSPIESEGHEDKVQRTRSCVEYRLMTDLIPESCASENGSFVAKFREGGWRG